MIKTGTTGTYLVRTMTYVHLMRRPHVFFSSLLFKLSLPPLHESGGAIFNRQTCCFFCRFVCELEISLLDCCAFFADTWCLLVSCLHTLHTSSTTDIVWKKPCSLLVVHTIFSAQHQFCERRSCFLDLLLLSRHERYTTGWIAVRAAYFSFQLLITGIVYPNAHQHSTPRPQALPPSLSRSGGPSSIRAVVRCIYSHSGRRGPPAILAAENSQFLPSSVLSSFFVFSSFCSSRRWIRSSADLGDTTNSKPPNCAGGYHSTITTMSTDVKQVRQPTVK